MNRRGALKKIGLSAGFIVATPAVLNLLQSCTNHPVTNWDPVFFSREEAEILTALVDRILPGTESYPGAAELGIPQFLDAFTAEVSEPEIQKKFRKGLQEIIREGKEPEILLEIYLKDPEKWQTEIYSTLDKIRRLSIWAYTTTEQVGEHILAHDPIPGTYDPCIPLEEATGGKAWSLV